MNHPALRALATLLAIGAMSAGFYLLGRSDGREKDQAGAEPARPAAFASRLDPVRIPQVPSGVPLPPVYPRAATAPVTLEGMNVNGHPTDVVCFPTGDSMDEVLTYYQRLWTEEGDVPTIATSEGFGVISTRRKSINWMVTALEDPASGALMVYLAAQNLSEGPSEEVRALPRLEDSFPIVEMSNPTGGVFRMEISGKTVQENRRFYEEKFASLGWEVLPENQKTPAMRSHTPDTQLLLFRKEGEVLTVSLRTLEQRGTAVLIMTTPAPF